MAKEHRHDLQWETEYGELIGAYPNGLRLVYSMMPQWFADADLKDTVCLRFIDPWGDTVFNQLQIPVLVAELEFLLASEHCQRHDELRRFEGVVAFIEKARGQVHTYIHFYGD